MFTTGIVLRKSLSSCLFCLILTVPQGTALGGAVSQEDSAQLSSEDSRAEELRSRRRQRLANVKRSQPSKVVDVLATVENDGFGQLVTFQVRHWRFGFGKISPVSSFTPAVQYERPRLGNTDLHLLASAAHWILLYGTAVIAAGAFSVRPVPIMGCAFLVAGALTLFLPSELHNLMLGASFGGLHIVFGYVIARHHGG